MAACNRLDLELLGYCVEYVSQWMMNYTEYGI